MHLILKVSNYSRKDRKKFDKLFKKSIKNHYNQLEIKIIKILDKITSLMWLSPHNDFSSTSKKYFKKINY